MQHDVDSDSNVTATLRLLRLLVKHAAELQTGLEKGFLGTPTRPWEGEEKMKLMLKGSLLVYSIYTNFN